MFKTIILCALYNLSDDQVEHQIPPVVHAISSRGPGSRRQDGVAVPRTINASWRDPLFETAAMATQGYLAMGGQIIDASIVAVPKQRNSREENAR